MTDQNPYQAPDSEPVVEIEKHKFPLFSTLLDVFVAPNKAFANIVQSGHGWWLPLIIVTLLTAIPAIYYPMSMTKGEYVEMQVEMMESTGQQVTSEMVAGFQMAADFAVFGSIAILILLPLFSLLSGLYYWLAGLLVAEERPKFSMGFNLAVWASLPLIFSSLVQVLNIMFSASTLTQAETDPTTLSNLLALDPATFIGAFGASINLFSIWGMALAFIGFKHLNGGGTTSAVIVAFILPLLLVAGLASLAGLFV